MSRCGWRSCTCSSEREESTLTKLKINGGTVVDPASGVDETGLDLLLVDGRVAERGRDLITSDDAEVIDATGLVVAPGFIDIHVHLREPGGEESETIASGCAAAAAGGFTALACMPNTEPVNDDPAVTRFILERAAEANGVRVWPIAAVTKGSLGEELNEYGLLEEAGAVALSDDGKPVGSAEVMRRALEYASQFDLVVIDHLEEPTMSRGWSMNEGAVATRLALLGMTAVGEEIMLVRDAILAALTGARVHGAHLSTAGALQRLREEKARGVAITGEVTPHHFALTDEAVAGYDTNTKMNPPLRTEADRKAVLEALADGTLDCIASDHAPHHVDKKQVEYDRAANGVIGVETTVPLVVDRLLHGGVVDRMRLVELLSTNPARIIGVPGGSLAVGAPADVTLLDPDREVQIRAAGFRSAGRNTPFEGWTLKGAPVATIVGGRVVWRREDAAAS